MDELAYPLKVRAHHLLCMLGFRGLGYSQEFILTMERVVERLREDAISPITVIAEPDIICASCPHNREHKCLKKAGSDSKVEARDSEVLRRLGLERGTKIMAEQIWVRLKERLSVEDIATICGDCEWLELGYCTEGLEQLKSN